MSIRGGGEQRGLRELTTAHHSPPHWMYQLSTNNYRHNRVADLIGMGGLILFGGGLVAQILALALKAHTHVPAIVVGVGLFCILLSIVVEIATGGGG